jgi:hypothetical protein
MNHPPGETNHDLYVVLNGGSSVSDRAENLFDPLAPKFLFHNNSAKDIGAYMMAARTVPCDLLFCIGSPARPRIDGWLDYMVRAVENNGPGIYGCWGFHHPSTHLRTTVFAITPDLLNNYPHTIDDARRYEFEHGKDCILLWCVRKGFAGMMVTARGEFPLDQFHYVDHRDSLFTDQHMDGAGFKE